MVLMWRTKILISAKNISRLGKLGFLLLTSYDDSNDGIADEIHNHANIIEHFHDITNGLNNVG